MENNKKRYLIIGIFAIIFTFFGGTLAYWQWETLEEQETAVNFEITEQFSCSVDGGGDVSSADKMLAPASCTNEKYAIQRTIIANADVKDANATVSMDLWLDVKSIDTELSESANFKYALTTDANSCTDGVIESGTFTGKSANSTAAILNDKIYTETGTDTYYLYVWLDSAEENPNTMDKHFSISLNGSCETIDYEKPYKETLLNGADPVLDDGMIPIILSSTGVATVADTTSEWYNYSNKEWANVVLVKKDATVDVEGSKSREYYLNNPGVEIVDEDILAYYVWIPRYKYKVWLMDGTTTSSSHTIDIVFENSESPKSVATQVGEYYTHPAFTFGSQELNGIWVGKFETTGTEDEPTILPNVSSLRGLCIGEDFLTSLKFAGGEMDTSNGNVTFLGNDIYGLTNNTDSHMMKNSEWGAVAYLSHSNYGINQEIYINNSSGFYTGRSGGNVGSSVNTISTQFGSGSTYDKYNSYGYYTWLGQSISADGVIGEITNATLGTMASTTGNITGVYDMSGGSDEYVMGHYGDTLSDYDRDSKFVILPGGKYYNLYNVDTTDDCTLETCGGHGLFETVSWYESGDFFVGSAWPWFHRGEDVFYDVRGGIFAFSSNTGYPLDNIDVEVFNIATFRSVLVRGK